MPNECCDIIRLGKTEFDAIENDPDTYVDKSYIDIFDKVCVVLAEQPCLAPTYSPPPTVYNRHYLNHSHSQTPNHSSLPTHNVNGSYKGNKHNRNNGVWGKTYPTQYKNYANNDLHYFRSSCSPFDMDGKDGNNNISYSVRKPLSIISNISPFKRNVLGYLNKLTHTNFIKISRNVVDLISTSIHSKDSSREDIDDIFNVITTKCICEHGYIRLYSNLFNIFFIDDSDIVRNLTAGHLNQFVTDSISVFWNDIYDVPHTADYDAFCLANKMAHAAIGRNLTILTLITDKHITMTRGNYFDILMSMYKLFVPYKRAELALDFLSTYIDIFNDRTEYEIVTLTEILESNAVVDHNRIRFKAMGIYESVFGTVMI